MNDEQKFQELVREKRYAYPRGFVPPTSRLYKLIATQAKEAGVAMDDIKLRVDSNKDAEGRYSQEIRLDRSTDNDNFVKNALIIGFDYPKLYDNMPALRGAIRHGLETSKQGFLAGILNDLRASVRLSIPKREEVCTADFAVGKDMNATLTAYTHKVVDIRNPEKLEKYTTPTASEPALIKRREAALIKARLEEATGITLKIEDVDFSSDCSFNITNPAKQKQISQELIDQVKGQVRFILYPPDKLSQKPSDYYILPARTNNPLAQKSASID